MRAKLRTQNSQPQETRLTHRHGRKRPEPSSEPVRMCIGCRRRAPQRVLMRLGLDPEAGFGLAQRPRSGRGAYVCPELRCLQRAIHKGGIGRALRSAAPFPTPPEIVHRASMMLRSRLERLSTDPGAATARAGIEALLAELESVLGLIEPGIPGTRQPVDVASGGGKVSHRAQTERPKGGPASAHG